MNGLKPAPVHPYAAQAAKYVVRLQRGETRDQWLLRRERARLQQLLDIGLSPLYCDEFDTYIEFLAPQFGGTEDNLACEIAMLRNDPEWRRLAAAVKATRGWDFDAALTNLLD